eukprot:914273-Rhodomonas_salina.1
MPCRAALPRRARLSLSTGGCGCRQQGRDQTQACTSSPLSACHLAWEGCSRVIARQRRGGR